MQRSEIIINNHNTIIFKGEHSCLDQRNQLSLIKKLNSTQTVFVKTCSEKDNKLAI